MIEKIDKIENLDSYNITNNEDYAKSLDSKETGMGQGFHNLLRDEGLTGEEILKPYTEEIDEINKKIHEIDKELGVSEANLEYKEKVIDRKNKLEKDIVLLLKEKEQLLTNDTLKKPSLIRKLSASLKNIFMDTDQRMVDALMKESNRIFEINQEVKETQRALKILSYEEELRSAHLNILEKLKFEKTKNLLLRKKGLGNLRNHLTSGDTAELN